LRLRAVVAGTAVDHVVAGAAVDQVGAAVAVEPLVAAHAADQVGPAPPQDAHSLRAVVGAELIVPRTAHQPRSRGQAQPELGPTNNSP
jgi:hypothetical protein